jgi:hypothetical protein
VRPSASEFLDWLHSARNPPRTNAHSAGSGQTQAADRRDRQTPHHNTPQDPVPGGERAARTHANELVSHKRQGRDVGRDILGGIGPTDRRDVRDYRDDGSRTCRSEAGAFSRGGPDPAKNFAANASKTSPVKISAFDARSAGRVDRQTDEDRRGDHVDGDGRQAGAGRVQESHRSRAEATARGNRDVGEAGKLGYERGREESKGLKAGRDAGVAQEPSRDRHVVDAGGRSGHHGGDLVSRGDRRGPDLGARRGCEDERFGGQGCEDAARRGVGADDRDVNSGNRDRRPYGESDGRDRRPYGESDGRDRRPYGESDGRDRRPYGESDGRDRRPYGERDMRGDREQGERGREQTHSGARDQGADDSAGNRGDDLGRDSLRPDTAQSAREQRLAERRSASSVLSAFVHVQMYVCMYMMSSFCVDVCLCVLSLSMYT